MMFNFEVNQHLFYALATGDSARLMKAMEATKPRPATAQWGQFLRNHDELDLGRLTDEQRQAVFAAFGPDETCSFTDAVSGASRAHAAGRPTPPGTRLQPYDDVARNTCLRYGDEIGMGDDLRLPERNCARTPMQWSDRTAMGIYKEREPVLPVISERTTVSSM